MAASEGGESSEEEMLAGGDCAEEEGAEAVIILPTTEARSSDKEFLKWLKPRGIKEERNTGGRHQRNLIRCFTGQGEPKMRHVQRAEEVWPLL